MTSEHLEDDVGTGLKCRPFGSLALTSTKVRNVERHFVGKIIHNRHNRQSVQLINIFYNKNAPAWVINQAGDSIGGDW